MSNRNDYRVTVKVRNNNILLAAEAAGHTSIPRLAEKIGCGYAMLNDLVNMTYSPLDRNGKVRPFVDALCAELGVPFDELFSEDQTTSLKTNKSEMQLNAEQVYALAHRPEIPRLTDDGLGDIVSGLLGELTEREAKVLRMRFGFEGGEPVTLAETGEIMGVGPERIRQIEAKALRKLRHPSRSKQLVDYYNET